MDRLHDVNTLFLKGICKQFGIGTQIVMDADISYSGQTPSEKLVSICGSLNADTYITGPAGLNYLSKDVFEEKEIEIEVMQYQYYKPYSQLHGNWIQNVTALDLLANVGSNSHIHLLGRTQVLE